MNLKGKKIKPKQKNLLVLIKINTLFLEMLNAQEEL